MFKILGISVGLPNLKKETTPPLIVAPTFILEVSNADHCLTNKGWECPKGTAHTFTAFNAPPNNGEATLY